MNFRSADLPLNEQLRLNILHAYHLPEKSADPAYADLAQLAAQICEAPIAIITLVDAQHLRFKATVGLSITAAPREGAFCAQVVETEAPLVVLDTHQDDRFAQHAWVINAPYVRCYAGVPLISPMGATLGTLAVLDQTARPFTEVQLSSLQALARQAVAQMELQFEQQHHQFTALRLAVIQQMNHLGTWQLYPQENRLLWTKDIYPIFGLEPSQFGETLDALLTLIHPEDREAFLQAQNRCLQTHQPLDIQHRIIRSDGEVRHVHQQGQSFSGDTASFPLMVGTMKDITAEKQAAAQQRAQQEKLHYAHDLLNFHLNNSPLAMVEWDGTFLVKRWSARAEALFGWSAADVLGKRPEDWSFVHPEDASLVEGKMLELLNGQETHNTLLNRNLTQAGKIVYCEWYNSVREDQAGNLISIFSLVQDVTERVMAEQATAAALERERATRTAAETAKTHFRALFESAPGLYLVLTPDEYQIVAVSQAYLQATMTEREHILGRHLFEVFPDNPDEPGADGTSNLRASLERVKALRQADAMAVQRYPIRTPTGEFEERYWSPLNSPVLGPQGEIAYIIYRVEDVTEYIHYKAQGGDKPTAWRTLETRAQQMEADIVLRSQELQRLNEQLRSSEERFRCMFTAAATGIVSADLNQRITSANDAFCQMVGYREADLLNLNFRAITHPDDRAATSTLMQELLARQRDSFVIEKRFLTKAGDVVWSRVSVSAQQDTAGHPLNLVAVAEDITQQKVMAEQLQESRTLARIGGYLGRLGGWAVNVDRNEVYWSEEIFDILEWPAGPPPSLDQALNLYPPQYRERLSEAIQTCAQVGTPFDLELELYTATRRRFWARAIGEAERNADGDIVRVIGAFQDITAQKQAESALERFAVRLRSTLENMTDAFYLLDHHWRFTYLNAEAERVLQRPTAELLGKVVWEAFPEASQTKLYQEYHQAIDANQSRHFELYYPPLAEWFEVNAHPSPEGLAVYFKTITERLALEEQLRQAQRLESLGQLTGGVAHDFNNLLTVIMGNTELMLELLAPTSALRPLAEIITNASQRGADLTQRLLAFARRQALDPKAVDMQQLLNSMLGLLRRTLGEHIEFEVLMPTPDLWPAFVDSAQLESVLLNLCLNARDAMPRGGKLSLQATNVQLDADGNDLPLDVQQGDYVLISVIDTGVGIAPDHLERVFEPFFTTKEKGKGTGLGLSMAYGFVKQSNGHIDICSELEQSTTVNLYLPRYRGEQNEIAKVEGMTNPVGTGECILLVEDDDLVRGYVHQQLQQLGYQVIVKSSGPDALEVIRQNEEIDLLFTDVVMPGGMSGRELGDAARRLRPNLKILYTSGYSEDAIVHQGRLDPGVKLLSKPYRRLELAQKLREVLDQKA